MVSWEDAVKFHGHECGGLAWGYKVALYALEKLIIDTIVFVRWLTYHT